MFKELYTNCDCHSFSHILKWSYLPKNHSIPDDTISELYLNINIEPSFSFFERLKRGFKYIFKINSNHYTEVILNTSSILSIQKFLKDYLEEYYKEPYR